MNHKIFALAMLALVPTLAVVPSGSAETVDAVCATVTVLTGDDLSGSFSATACGTAVGYVALRNPTTSTVTWTISTDAETRTCTWPADSAASCSGSGPIPASQGSTFTVSVTATAGDLVFATNPDVAL